MKKADSTVKLIVITSTDGRVVAAAGPTAAAEKGFNTGIAPLPGQLMHEIEVPEAVMLLGAVDKHNWLQDHLALAPEGRRVMRVKTEVRIKKHER
jgi:hypothetical protein